MTRIAIIPKDISMLTGSSLRCAQRTLKEIRESLGKHKKAIVTIDEYCQYNLISRDEVLKVIAGKKAA